MRQKIGKKFGSYNGDKKPLWVRSWDYTWSLNGDHIHLHNLILFETTPTEEEFCKLEFETIEAWLKLIKKNLGRDGSKKACRFDRVYDVEGVAKYNNKIGSIAFEIASNGLTKKSHSNSLNIWELIWAIQIEKDETRKAKLIKKFRLFEKQTESVTVMVDGFETIEQRTLSFGEKFKAFVGNFLIEIGKMILKAAILAGIMTFIMPAKLGGGGKFLDVFNWN